MSRMIIGHFYVHLRAMQIVGQTNIRGIHYSQRFIYKYIVEDSTHQNECYIIIIFLVLLLGKVLFPP